MKLLIDNLEIDIINVTFRDFGFGKEVPNKEKARYFFHISLEEFIAVSEKLINDFVNECKIDDEISIVETMGLRELGYPMFEQILGTDKSLLIELIKEYLPLEFLSGFFKSNEKTEWKYAINTIENIHFDNSKVIVSGYAYSISQN